MKHALEKLEGLLEKGGIKKDIILLVISGAAVICSLLKVQPLPFDMAWIAIVLCGVPIILEALIGLVTRFDIKADVLGFPGADRFGVHRGGLCRRRGGSDHVAGGFAGGADCGTCQSRH